MVQPKSSSARADLYKESGISRPEAWSSASALYYPKHSPQSTSYVTALALRSFGYPKAGIAAEHHDLGVLEPASVRVASTHPWFTNFQDRSLSAMSYVWIGKLHIIQHDITAEDLCWSCAEVSTRCRCTRRRILDPHKKDKEAAARSTMVKNLVTSDEFQAQHIAVRMDGRTRAPAITRSGKLRPQFGWRTRSDSYDHRHEPPRRAFYGS